MYYSYILESQKYPGSYYVGSTSDLKQRLADHNEGKQRYTRDTSFVSFSEVVRVRCVR